MAVPNVVVVEQTIGNVRGIDASGSQLWLVDTDNSLWADIIRTANNNYFALGKKIDDAKLYKFNSAGGLKWTYTKTGWGSSEGGLTYSDAYVYGITSDGWLFKFSEYCEQGGVHYNPSTGKVATRKPDYPDWVYDILYEVTDYIYSSVTLCVYRCIKEHTSTYSDGPGFGGNWQTYWELIPMSGNVFRIGVSPIWEHTDGSDNPFSGVAARNVASGNELYGAWRYFYSIDPSEGTHNWRDYVGGGGASRGDIKLIDNNEAILCFEPSSSGYDSLFKVTIDEEEEEIITDFSEDIGDCYHLEINSIYVYIAGDFTGGGRGVRKYNFSLGLQWECSIAGVNSVCVADDGYVWACGSRITIGGQTNRNLHKISPSTGTRIASYAIGSDPLLQICGKIEGT